MTTATTNATAPSSGAAIQERNDFTFVDLFAGIGGFASGLGSGNFEGLKGLCLLAAESDHEARWLYEKNHGVPACGRIFEDVRDMPSLDTTYRSFPSCISGNDVEMSTTERGSSSPSTDDASSQHSDSPRNIHILCAGFPCQSFSQSAGGAEKGFECEKNGNLFFEIVRLLKKAENNPPRALLLENVPNLLNIDEGKAFETIREQLEKCGYEVHWRVLNSAKMANLPQNRDRLYIVGIHRGSPTADVQCNLKGSASRDSGFAWPAEADPGAGEEACSSSGVDGPEEKNNKCVAADVTTPKRKLVRDILEHPCESVPDEYFLTEHQWEKMRQHRSYLTSKKRRLVEVDGLARTLSARYKTGWLIQSEFVPRNYERHGKCDDGADEDQQDAEEARGDLDIAETPTAYDEAKPRFFTLRECARLQGFPESFCIENRRNRNRFYHQCGNAVCPPVVAKIAKQILAALDCANAVAASA